MSHIRYGITVWGRARGANFNSMAKLIKKATRAIEIGKIHTEPIRKRNKILDLCELVAPRLLKSALT